ncbi:MAG TPA: DUF6098 family protein [Jatrophihabitans sp.]|nr:DUF6098 family protein [Jatrophihabitans sp.]
MDVVRSLDELAQLVDSWQDGRRLYVRWTDDVLRDIRTEVSRDELTGIELPGLSANSLHVETWWDGRPLATWLARRLYDYRHLHEDRGPDTRPWVLAGVETGRGPDNEPLIANCRVVAEVELCVIDAATEAVDQLGHDWGTMRRS